MIYHVLPGDAQVEDFRKTGIPGELIVFREAFVTGPIDAIDVNEFWDHRAHFILSEYAEDEISYHEKVADEILRISDIGPDDEVNLWFEFELFCSVNFWYCLNELKDSGRIEAAARCYRGALAIAPAYADAHFNLALTHEKLGRSSDANPHWVSYRRQAPKAEWVELAREISE